MVIIISPLFHDITVNAKKGVKVNIYKDTSSPMPPLITMKGDNLYYHLIRALSAANISGECLPLNNPAAAAKSILS
jgi:hypothetical protein